MNDIQLEYFCTLAKTMHLGKAAELLYVSPPSLSTTIKRIEAELGVPLFKKSGRNIELTEYGKVFLPKAEAMLKLYSEAKDDISNIKHIELNRVIIGGGSLSADPQLLSKILMNNINISFEKDNYSNNEMIVSALNSNNMDIYISARTIDDPTIEKQWLYSESQYLVCSKEHPLAHKKNITVKEISQCLFAAGRKDTTQRLIFDQLCGKLEFKPKIAVVAGSTRALIGMALADPSLVIIIPKRLFIKDLKDSSLSILDTEFEISRINVFSYRSKQNVLSQSSIKIWNIISEYFANKEE